MTSRSPLVFSLSILLVASTASAQPANEGPEVIEVEVEGGEDQYEYEYEVPDAPVYEITTPGYQQDPYYGQRPHRPRQYRIPYQEGMEIPPGGHVIKRRRMGLAIPGTIFFAIPYLSTVIVWTSEPAFDRTRVSGTVLIPVFGPFIAAAQASASDYYYSSGLRAGLIFNGIMQLVGVTMMTFGFMGKRYLVYYADVNDRQVAFRLTPFASRDGGGASLGVTF
jgi:hypothetical protein